MYVEWSINRALYSELSMPVVERNRGTIAGAAPHTKPTPQKGGLLPRVGPDDYTESTTEELSEADLAILNKVWPAAFLAVSSLLLMLDDGDVTKDSPFMSMNLFSLVYASFENQDPEEVK